MNRKFLDAITYVGLGSKRKLKRYVVASITLILFLFAVIIYAAWGRNRMAAGAPLVALPAAITTPAAPSLPSPTPEACPSDPGDWKLIEVFPGDNLGRIEPACVYDGLGRTIAWVLAIREGYSRADASQSLGFTQPPAQAEMSVLKVIDPVGSSLMASLVMVPLTAGYSEWYIDGKDLPAMYYFPQGCFRGIDTVGNKVQIWNGSYSVICYIVEDNAATHTIMSLGGHVFSASSSPTRSYLYFGYDTETKQWDWLGIDEVLSYSTDVATMSSDHKNNSGQYGGSVWSAQWLSQTYGLAMKALPDGWKTDNEQAEFQAILNSINSSNAP